MQVFVLEYFGCKLFVLNTLRTDTDINSPQAQENRYFIDSISKKIQSGYPILETAQLAVFVARLTLSAGYPCSAPDGSAHETTPAHPA